MTTLARAFLPDLLLAGGEVRAGAALNVREGVVASVGAPEPGLPVVRLPGKAVLPGLVSAHGHSFQRAIRGRTQVRHPGRSDFWSWREAMYGAAARLDPDDVYAVARMAFQELALSGVTAVGEFHYLARDPQGRPYADPERLARLVIRAARETGLRIVLLRVAYARGGAGRPAEPGQVRFVDATVEEVVASAARLADATRGDPGVRVGLAPHSVRACPADWIGALATEARRRGWPLHVHASEQPAEVEQCRAEHGVTPVGLLERVGALGPQTTAVHAIHLTAADVEALGRARATVCACPTTERDLGDGVVPADALLRAGASLALGVDSHVQVDLLEDARALEGNLRLLRRERGVLAETAADGRIDGLAARLHAIASAGGMRSLGIAGGSLRPDEPADFLAIDLADSSVAGASAGDLLPTVVFSAARTAVTDVFVGGEDVVRDRAPAAGRPAPATVVADFARTMRKLWGG
jgi:formimidoylglutamate deiminase